jgi:lipopolysaccharide export LptBFGC system permease protein LptF
MVDPLNASSWMAMFRISPVSQAWIRTLRGPFIGAMFALIVVASVVLSAQIILRAPFVPGLLGAVTIWVAMLPETIGILAPAAAFIAVVLAGQNWKEGGEIQALFASGLGGRALVLPTLAVGLVVAVGVGVCSQWLGPMGRGVARNVLVSAAAEASLRPGPMVQVGDVWIRVGTRDHSLLKDIVVAADSWIAWAPTAERLSDGSVQLHQGQARGLDEQWSMGFKRATISVGAPGVGTHNFERGHQEMRQRIKRMESKGRSAHRERLTLYKRSMLPLSVPFLALLGIPLGICFRRPAFFAGGVILSLWIVQRLGDHGASTLGPGAMALVPVLYVGVLLGMVWFRWRSR